MMNKCCCCCEGLEIDVELFQAFHYSSRVCWTMTWCICLVFYLLYCFPKPQSLAFKSHCHILEFSWVLGFYFFVSFIYNRGSRSWLPYCCQTLSSDYFSWDSSCSILIPSPIWHASCVNTTSLLKLLYFRFWVLWKMKGPSTIWPTWKTSYT
jgi:hypothetical protein